MPEHDGHPAATHPRPHPDLAAWVLGACEPEEAEAFEAHLAECADCQAELRELEGLPDRLSEAAPPFELPPGLEARTLGAVRLAAAKQRRRRIRQVMWVAAASVMLLAVISAGVLLRPPSPDFVWELEGVGNVAAQGEATARQTDAGWWEVELVASGLPAASADEYYECWYVGSDDSPASPDRAIAGSFRPAEDGTARVTMAVFAANPNRFPVMEIVLEPANGDPEQTGTVILTGEGQPA
jgi:hypothetical protein